MKRLSICKNCGRYIYMNPLGDWEHKDGGYPLCRLVSSMPKAESVGDIVIIWEES